MDSLNLSEYICPCGSTKRYEACCGLYIDGQTSAPTPISLMRSRYTAYTQANITYIIQTMRSRALQDFDEQEAKQWAQQAQWQCLEVLRDDIDPNNTHIGFVEFKAYYHLNGKNHTLHELSEFHKVQDQWFYVGACKTVKTPRNAPCPCGSGKKYKKCCAAR